jgi:hypothetical protein
MQHLQVLVLLAETHYDEREYRLAEGYYRKAVEARKAAVKSQASSGKTRKSSSAADSPLSKNLSEHGT